jgi:hypothetical protein
LICLIWFLADSIEAYRVAHKESVEVPVMKEEITGRVVQTLFSKKKRLEIVDTELAGFTLFLHPARPIRE